MKINVIITGTTGMVGEGVLHECLKNTDVEKVLVINRKPCGINHDKLQEIVHGDFFDLSGISEYLKGYDACFFCLGVTSINKKEEEYYKLTYTLTIKFAELILEQNPDTTFCYISGAGTDSSEKGKSMWARVKGKTENDLMRMKFKKVYCFRPGYLQPTKGLAYSHSYYKWIGFLYP
ncbi:MAG: NAD-dependent epimerase/dehydratase family protein, partial [Ignavibacteria bacterium]